MNLFLGFRKIFTFLDSVEIELFQETKNEISCVKNHLLNQNIHQSKIKTDQNLKEMSFSGKK